MFIRSQDKTILIKSTRLEIVNNQVINLISDIPEKDYDILGIYETAERTVAVMDLIQDGINNSTNDYTVCIMPEK